MAIVEGTAENFKGETTGTPAVVDFWAEWCGPCKRLGPIFHDVAEKMSDKVKFIKVDVDNNQELAADYQVMSIPTIILLKDGAEVERIVGAPSKDSLESKINEVFGL